MSNPTDNKSSFLPELTEQQKQDAISKIKNMSLKEKLSLVDSIVTLTERNEKTGAPFDYKTGYTALKSAVSLSFDIIEELSLDLEKERKALDQLSLSVILKKALNHNT